MQLNARATSQFMLPFGLPASGRAECIAAIDC